MKLSMLNQVDFLRQIVDYKKHPTSWNYLGSKPALVKFYADWCGSCKAIRPVLERLAESYKGELVIYSVNTEQEEEIAAVFGVRCTPTLLFIPLGERPQLARGAIAEEPLREMIESILLGRTTHPSAK